MRRQCRVKEAMPTLKVLKLSRCGCVLAIKQKCELLTEGSPPNYMRVHPLSEARGAIPNNEGNLSVSDRGWRVTLGQCYR